MSTITIDDQQVLALARELVGQGLSLARALNEAQHRLRPPSSISGARSIVDRAVRLEQAGLRVDEAWAAATRGRAPGVVRMARRTFDRLGQQGKRTEASARAHGRRRDSSGRFTPLDGFSC